MPGERADASSSGSQWERGLRYVGGGVEERKTTEEARRAVPKERGQRDQRGRSGVPAYRMTRGGVGPGCAYIHIDQSIKAESLGYRVIKSKDEVRLTRGTPSALEIYSAGGAFVFK